MPAVKIIALGLLAGVAICPTVSLAQGQSSPAPQSTATPAATPATTTAATPAAADVLLKKEQLEQLVSPIALYPDNLLAQVMMASTYPLEVVEASRWLTANKNLKGKALQDAAEKQKWDE